MSDRGGTHSGGMSGVVVERGSAAPLRWQEPHPTMPTYHVVSLHSDFGARQTPLSTSKPCLWPSSSRHRYCDGKNVQPRQPGHCALAPAQHCRPQAPRAPTRAALHPRRGKPPHVRLNFSDCPPSADALTSQPTHQAHPRIIPHRRSPQGRRQDIFPPAEEHVQRADSPLAHRRPARLLGDPRARPRCCGHAARDSRARARDRKWTSSCSDKGEMAREIREE